MTDAQQKQSGLILTIALSVLLLISCGDALNITGITETDETGPEPIGNVDEDDWCSNSTTGGTTEWAIFPAYPNPTNGEVTIRIFLNHRFWVKLQIINKDDKVIRILLEDKIEDGDEAKRGPGGYTRKWDARGGEKIIPT